MRTLLLLTTLFFPLSSILAMDTLITKDKNHQGTFQEYKNNRFYFQPTGEKTVSFMKNVVTALTLDPPAKVSLKPFGGKEIDDAKFKSYDNGKFTFEENGGEKVYSSISTIKVGLDFARSMQLHEETKVVSHPEQIDLGSSVKPGVVTIIHFHIPSVMSSVRQGNYVDLLAEQNMGKIEIVRMTFDNWTDEGLEKYQITSLPQFWIYDKKGQLAKKLVDRFTEEDIDSELEKVGGIATSKKKKKR